LEVDKVARQKGHVFKIGYLGLYRDAELFEDSVVGLYVETGPSSSQSIITHWEIDPISLADDFHCTPDHVSVGHGVPEGSGELTGHSGAYDAISDVIAVTVVEAAAVFPPLSGMLDAEEFRYGKGFNP